MFADAETLLPPLEKLVVKAFKIPAARVGSDPSILPHNGTAVKAVQVSVSRGHASADPTASLTPHLIVSVRIRKPPSSAPSMLRQRSQSLEQATRGT